MSRPIEVLRKVVGCDLDDVLADFMTKFISMAKAHGFGPDDDRRPIDWEWSNMGWSQEQQDILWQELHDTQNFWVGLQPLPQVDRGLVFDLSDRTTLYFPTARAKAVGADTRDQAAWWLRHTSSGLHSRPSS